MTFELFPEAASTTAKHVDWLYWSLTGLSAIVIALVFVPLLYLAVKYRRGSSADRSLQETATWPIEVTWTIVPLFIVMGVFAWNAVLYFDIERPPANALQINVVGKQWMWKLQHEKGNREINEVHVPLGRTVVLLMTSQDVIHDFFIPAFRVKQDVVPGRYTTEWFTPTRLGTYHIFCAQFCGTSHSRMIGHVHVVRPDDFEKWLTSGAPAEPVVATGARLFRELGCSGCHGASATIRAPKLEELYGKPVPLEGGQIVMADERYLRDSILLPAVQIAAGYQNVMPSFQGRVSEEEVMQLIAYMKSLAANQPGKAIK